MPSNISELLTFIFGCYGLTMILCYGKILDFARIKIPFFNKMTQCSLCTGFWSGMLISLFFFNAYYIMLFGFVGSGTSYILDKLISDDGIQIKRG
jgi:hypothetical protein